MCKFEGSGKLAQCKWLGCWIFSDQVKCLTHILGAFQELLDCIWYLCKNPSNANLLFYPDPRCPTRQTQTVWIRVLAPVCYQSLPSQLKAKGMRHQASAIPAKPRSPSGSFHRTNLKLPLRAARTAGPRSLVRAAVFRITHLSVHVLGLYFVTSLRCSSLETTKTYDWMFLLVLLGTLCCVKLSSVQLIVFQPRQLPPAGH